VPRPYYLDASAITRWAEWRGEATDQRNSTVAEYVRRLIDDKEVRIATSELSIAEFHSNICGILNDQARKSHDETWFDTTFRMLMQWIADGRLLVIKVPPKLAELAMVYAERATREFGRRFKLRDAMHLYQACDWSRSLGEQVELITTDDDFEQFLKLFPEFGIYVVAVDPAKPPNRP
jgi:hypothetical protein